jgi:hypothetical protein
MKDGAYHRGYSARIEKSNRRAIALQTMIAFTRTRQNCFDCADESRPRNALAIEIRVSYDRDADVLSRVALFTMFSCKLAFNLMHALDFTLLAS